MFNTLLLAHKVSTQQDSLPADAMSVQRQGQRLSSSWTPGGHLYKVSSL